MGEKGQSRAGQGQAGQDTGRESVLGEELQVTTLCTTTSCCCSASQRREHAAQEWLIAADKLEELAAAHVAQLVLSGTADRTGSGLADCGIE